MILRNLFNTFMIYLNEHLAHDQHEQVILQMARTITANVENPDFRVSEAGGDAPLSHEHLRRLFTERIGKTPMRYLIDLRMQRARELLAMGFSVKETADKVGLPDQYYFSRLFRSTQGASPSGFRKQSARPA
jgi:AraC-like DNA-binding protein